MHRKQQQLRLELRFHLNQVLQEEQQKYPSFSPSTHSHTKSWPWFEPQHTSSPTKSELQHQLNVVLSEQIEEASRRKEREAKQRMEDELKWETYYASRPAPLSPISFHSSVPERNRREELKLQLALLSKQLEELEANEKEEEEEEAAATTAVFASSLIESDSKAERLEVSSKYFVFVAGKRGESQVEVPPPCLPSLNIISTTTPEKEEDFTFYTTSDDEDDFISDAAKMALRRADSSSSTIREERSRQRQ